MNAIFKTNNMKTLFILALVLIGTIATAQSSLGHIKIKSKIELVYDSRTQDKDTLFVTIKEWSYNPIESTYMAKVVDYAKNEVSFLKINEKTRIFSKAEVDGLFTVLSNSILYDESYSSEMDILLSTALLLDTQTNLFENGTTIYGGVPANWELITD